METDPTGEVYADFLQAGSCSLWHETAVRVATSRENRLELDWGNIICEGSSWVVATPVGKFEVGSTFRVIMNEAGMVVTVYEGGGTLRSQAAEQGVELGVAETATVRPDGTISDVTEAQFDALDSVRIEMIGGEISEAVRRTPEITGFQDLALGDCVESLPMGETIQTLLVVPCSRPHAAVVTTVFDLPGDGGTPYPSEIHQRAARQCSAESDTPVPPAPEYWQMGGRRTVCFRLIG